MLDLGCYMIGSMEFRKYEELFYEHFYIRTQLQAMGIKVTDPLLKEKHNPKKVVTLTKCGLDPRKVYEMDLKAVEDNEIMFWITGDVISEGSLTEIATAGAWNRWKKGKKKTIVIVSPDRYSKKRIHFSNFHIGVKIVNTAQEGLDFIRRRYKL